MDIKVKGLTHEILAQALEQAREARLFVLDKMLAVIPKSRSEMSAYAPRITTIMINPDKIRDVIGPEARRSARSPRRQVRSSTSRTTDVCSHPRTPTHPPSPPPLRPSAPPTLPTSASSITR